MSIAAASWASPGRSTWRSSAVRRRSSPTNTYLRLEGPPGPVEVDCKVGDKTGGGQVQIGEGRTRYVEVSMKVGLMLPGCEVAEVPPEQGQAAVRGSRRVAPQ